MANFEHLFGINDSGFFLSGDGAENPVFIFGNEVVGPKRNNHHGFDKPSSTYVDVANRREAVSCCCLFQVKFRAYGGGGAAPIEVHSVSVSPGHCGSSGNVPSRKE